MEKLKLKLFGPIDSINLTLNKIILLIGPQASGKSTISKLISIMRDSNFIGQKLNFEDSLESFGILSYLNKNTEILYSSKNYEFKYINEKGVLTYKNHSYISLMESFTQFQGEYIQEEYDAKLVIAKEILLELDNKKNLDVDSKSFKDLIKRLNPILNELENANNQLNQANLVGKKILNYSKFSIYIPSERNLFSSILSSKFSFDQQAIPLPKTLLKFGSLIEQARNTVESFEIPYFNLRFNFSKNESYLIDEKKNKSFLLNNSSSGLQSLIPLVHVLISKSSVELPASMTFVIEEPELNLFPMAQYELMKVIIYNCYTKKRVDSDFSNDLILTTHSPYCLSSINNMLMAKKTYDISKSKKVEKIIGKDYWINSEDFSAYYLNNGKAKSILDKSTGLIDENELDAASYDINNDFQNLLDIIPVNND